MIIFVGRFEALKRPLTFLDVAERILAERPDVRFVMQGEGPLRAAIERRLAGATRLSRAVALEDAQASVARLMADADLLVLTSAMEGIAYVSYEAMAMGLVQVSAKVGGQGELITPDCGLLIEPGRNEVARYARACLQLLADTQRRKRMSANARARIRQWPEVHAMGRSYQDLYLSLLSQTPRTRDGRYER